MQIIFCVINPIKRNSFVAQFQLQSCRYTWRAHRSRTLRCCSAAAAAAAENTGFLSSFFPIFPKLFHFFSFYHFNSIFSPIAAKVVTTFAQLLPIQIHFSARCLFCCTCCTWPETLLLLLTATKLLFLIKPFQQCPKKPFLINRKLSNNWHKLLLINNKSPTEVSKSCSFRITKALQITGKSCS